MKKILLISICLLAFACTGKQDNASGEHADDHSNHTQENEVATPGKQVKSPHTEVMAMLGGNHIHIDYSSPRVRGRQIFGGLVAFGEVWSTGAHKATAISFTQDMVIENKEVKAGKYALFTIPGEKEWVVILNKIWDQHLADKYDPKEDILRLNVAPKVEESSVEELTFKVIPKDDNSGVIRFQWDKTSIEFNIRNK